jgi:hypothetical protein
MRIAQSFFVAFMLALTASAALAQSNGAISGQVTDSSKAPVPGVRVLVTSVETGVQRSTTTNGDGEYTVPSLPPGNYIVTAELSGFKRSMAAPLKLDTTATARVDLVLSPQESKVAVEVTATAPSLQTESSMTGGTVSGKELSDLPLQGRNSLELALTVAGVSGEMGADEASISYNIPSAGSGLTVSGGRAGSTSIMADGANATSIGYGRATVTFSPDTIQEFRVITSTFSAQYGVVGGGVISTVSKGGTDEIHGDAFWFNRNPMFTARTFGQPFPSALRRNEVGVTLGGPLVIPKLYSGKRKTFFFVSYEAKRRRDETSQLERVPTAAERQGDFRNTWVAPGQTNPLLYQQMECSAGGCNQLQQLYRPNANTEYPLFSANDPDPSRVGHVIPAQFLSPVALKQLEYVPLPNMPYDFFGRNFLGVSGVTGMDNRWSIKIDHNFSSNNRISARYTDIPNLSDRYKLIRDYFLAESPPSDRSVTRQGFISDTYVISSHIVNEFRGSYTYSDYSRTLPGDLKAKNYTRDVFGLPSATDSGYPSFSTQMVNLGSITGPIHSIEHQYQASDDATMALGRHIITSGVDLRFMQSSVVAAGNRNLEACCGIYVFNTGTTNSGYGRTPGGQGGYGFASFLLGVPVQTIVTGNALPYYYRYRTVAAFFQDDFKVRPSLTLNLGVRWQYVSPRAEKYNRQASLDLKHPMLVQNANGSTSYAFNYVFSGDASGSRYLEPTHKLNFEPRFGFAWTPHVRWNKRNSFVVRGGYGISHIAATATGRDPQPAFSAGNPGNFSYLQWTGRTGATVPRPQSGGVDPNYLISLGRNNPLVFTDPTASEIPANGLLCLGCPVRDPRLPSTTMTFVDSNRTPYIQTWNFTTQNDLGHSLVLTLTYMGQKGTHLPSGKFNLNNPDPEQFAALLDQGGNPDEMIPDPLGRKDRNGQPINVARRDLMRPYPLLGDVFVLGITDNNSIYHAGSAAMERRFKGVLGFRFNYTFSKSIDDSSDGMGDFNNQFNWGYSFLQDPANRKGNRSVSNYDSRHRFNLALNADLPLGRGHQFLNRGGWTNVLVGSWSLNAVGTLYSGYPFAPLLGDANGIPGAQANGLALRPSLVPGVPLINPRWTREHAHDVPYFNPEAFARPAYGQIGNAPRTMDNLRGPWRPGLNVSVFKSFYPFEDRRRYVQFRAEFFNALNHTWFTMNPNSSVKVFNSQPQISRTGLSLAGPIPYLVGSVPQYPVGTRENLIAASYNYNFGVFNKDNNNPGRIIQLAAKIFW